MLLLGTEQKLQRSACRAPREGIRQSRFLFASGFTTLILAHMADSLVRVSRRVGSVQWAGSWPQGTERCRLRRGPQPGARRAAAGARSHVARRVAGPETILHRRGGKPPTPGQTDSLASNNFTYSFTFFPKFFSSFPHGTCSLSVSRKYLALEGRYLLISAAVPSNTTHDGGPLFGEDRTARDCYPLRFAISTTNCTRLPAIAPPQGYNATARGGSFSY